VYCSDCFAKVKASKASKEEESVYAKVDTADLAELGIEFESSARRQEPQKAASGKPASRISLSDLKPPSELKRTAAEKNDKKEKSRSSPDLQSLRQALKDALNKEE